MNAPQDAGAIEDRELCGIATVGFDPVAGAARNQRGGDAIAWHTVGLGRPLDLKPHGPGS